MKLRFRNIDIYFRCFILLFSALMISSCGNDRESLSDGTTDENSNRETDSSNETSEETFVIHTTGETTEHTTGGTTATSMLETQTTEETIKETTTDETDGQTTEQGSTETSKTDESSQETGGTMQEETSSTGGTMQEETSSNSHTSDSGTQEETPAQTTEEVTSGETSDRGRCGDPPADGTPAITIEQVTSSSVAGCVYHINTTTVSVVFYSKTDIWYVQPFIANPYTLIASDGYWESFTHPWNVLAAYIVKPGHPVPSTSGNVLPLEVDGENVFAYTVYPSDYIERSSRSFAGYRWQVKSGEALGPGPNNWSNSNENVWVDEEDALHLQITYRNDKWWCAEVRLSEPLGFGTYTFTVASPIDMLDPQAVGALFLYYNDETEIDIEFSRWGDSNADKNGQFVVQPYTHSGNLERFSILLDAYVKSTHQIQWTREAILFRSVLGENIETDENLIYQWEYQGTDIPTSPEQLFVYLNLWLFRGSPPLSAEAQEMIVSAFSFTPE